MAVATGLLYWVLVTNVDREDDQFLVDTVQIIRALIRERPDDLAALRQEVDWEGTARRYARVYLRVLDERGRVVIETPGATPILARHALTPADVASEPGPGVELTSPAGTPYRMLAAWATLGGNADERRLVQVALDRTAERQLLRDYRSRLWGVLALALAEHLARVSDRFYRVDASRSSADGGLGLGLAIVRSIVSVHGGSMQVLSDYGRGTTVRLVFPDISNTRPDVRTTHDSETLASS